jgi:hypothetical protein
MSRAVDELWAVAQSDLSALISRMDRDTISHRVREFTAALRSDPRRLDAAKQSWYVLFGEDLPP